MRPVCVSTVSEVKLVFFTRGATPRRFYDPVPLASGPPRWKAFLIGFVYARGLFKRHDRRYLEEEKNSHSHTQGKMQWNKIGFMKTIIVPVSFSSGSSVNTVRIRYYCRIFASELRTATGLKKRRTRQIGSLWTLDVRRVFNDFENRSPWRFAIVYYLVGSRGCCGDYCSSVWDNRTRARAAVWPH